MLALCAFLAVQEVAKSGALSPEEELAAFTVAPGFVVELVAAEPDTPKVVDVAFDDAGRMWAVTAVEYPVDGNETPEALELYRRGGRDRVLVFDTPTAPGRQTPRTFADGLALPLAILPYRDGALVGHGPDVLFLRDTDGDGRADVREVVLTGFGIQDSHLLPHRFTRGPGGWIYVAQGAFNESDVRAGDGTVTEFDKCKVGRFKPDGSRFELVGVGLNNIWGFVIDRLGRFFVQEANDLGYPVVPFHLGASYPGIGSHRFRPYSPWQPPLADFRVGGTGLSGLALSEDPGGFPDDWDGVFLVANPVMNAIQSIRLYRDGDVPRLERVDDLLTSADPWFRPIAIHFGPDGFLYVVDWYNKVLSHNEVPRDHPDRDKTRGRIWRIRPVDAPRPEIPDLTAVPDRELMLHFAADSTWEARAAWHQLVEREAVELAPALELAAFDDELPAATRLLALWSLEELGRARVELLEELLDDDDAAVRREAVRVLGNLGLPARDLAQLLMDQPALRTGAQVRFACVRALDALPDPGEPGIATLVAFVRPAIPATEGPRVRLQDRNEEVHVGAAADCDFERSLIRKALEEHQDTVLAFLDSAAGRVSSSEGRALALLALGGEEGAMRLADLLPGLDRGPSREELVLLAEHATASRVRTALGALLEDHGGSETALTLLLEAGDRV
ncbi:MAG: hypothetical protein O7B99_07430, partial [Planctomycetota bacterium]|nr:hypothetical protein [Planctomycetota bacterium]